MEGKIFLKSKNNLLLLLLLLLLFIVVKLIFLFYSQVILGGDEAYKTILLLHNYLEGTLDVGDIKKLVMSYSHFPSFIQVISYLPFYFFYPTNEFAVFLSTLTAALFNFCLSYYLLLKIFRKDVAILFSIGFIFSPLGLTLTTVSMDSPPGAMIHLLFMIIFYYLFFSQSVEVRENSAFFLGMIPLITPYHLILWPTSICYLILMKHYKNNSDINNNSCGNIKIFNYLLKILLGFIISAPFYFNVFIDMIKKYSASISDAGMKIIQRDQKGPLGSIIDRILQEVNHLAQPFIATNTNMDFFLSSIAYTSLFCFMIILLVQISNHWKKMHRERYVDPSIFFILYVVFFVLTEILFQIKLYFWQNRLLGLESKYLTLFLFNSLILVSGIYYIDHKFKKCFKLLFSFFILCNIIINAYFIWPLKKQNNFILYNLGGHDYKRKEVTFFIKKSNLITMLYSLQLILELKTGLSAREKILSRDSVLFTDPVLYGYGIKIYYGNKLGINWCKILEDDKQCKLCERGYVFLYEELEEYIKKNRNFILLRDAIGMELISR